MKRINREAMGRLAIRLMVILLFIAAISWLSSLGPVKNAVAQLTQLNLYSDYVHHHHHHGVIYLPIVMRQLLGISGR